MTDLTPVPEDADLTPLPSPPRDRIGQIAGIAGKVLIGAGVIVLLFAVFQVFGTGYIESQHQSSLRSTFEKQLQAAPPTTTTVVPGPPTTVGTLPTPSTGSPTAIIEIPLIHVNQVVIQGTNDAQLQQGPGHYTNTPLPGQTGNVGIAGHRTTWGHPFYNLDQLKPGNKIILVTTYGTFTYHVTTSQIVAPSDVAVLNPTPNATVTLTTCNPRYSAAQRLVVSAALFSSSTATIASSTTTTTSTPGKSTTTTTAPVQSSNSQSWVPSVLLGLLTALLGAATLILKRRIKPAWAVYLVGGIVTFGALMFFFGAISQILPSSI